ncbi:hypothetical protein ACK3TF_004046 [Chlorella vulgaris]
MTEVSLQAHKSTSLIAFTTVMLLTLRPAVAITRAPRLRTLPKVSRTHTTPQRAAAARQHIAVRRHLPPLAAAAIHADPPAVALDTVPDVHVELVFAIEDHCTLQAKSSVEGQWNASTTAVIAAALVNLSNRERLLDEAVATARRELPGVLDAQMLKQFDAVKARGEVGTAMALLGFKQLQALCERIAPDVWREVQQEIVEEAARQKASHMRPVPDDSRRNIRGRAGAAGWGGNDSVGRCGEANWLRGSRGYGPKLRLLQSFDLPSALVRLPRWHSWLKRLRDEVVAWQLEQRKLQKAAQQEGQQKQQPQQEAPSASKRPLVASFTLNATTPDGLPMRQEIRITVDPPGARELLSLVRRNGFGAFAQAASSPLLRRLAELPETQLRDALKAAAWNHIELNTSCIFDCTLLPPKQPAGSEGAGAGSAPTPPAGAGSGVAGGAGEAHPFHFESNCFDMKMLVLALSWMLEEKKATGVWCPYDGRIALQRCVDKQQGGLRGLLRRPAAARAADGEGEAKYRLRVLPPEQPGIGAAAAAAGAAGGAAAEQQQLEQPGLQQERTTVLSQAQLEALMDCMDAFCHQHPGFVRLELPEPLPAPKPRLLQGLDSWLRGDEAAAGSGQPSSGIGKPVAGSSEPAVGSGELASGSVQVTADEAQALLAAARDGAAGGAVTVV